MSGATIVTITITFTGFQVTGVPLTGQFIVDATATNVVFTTTSGVTSGTFPVLVTPGTHTFTLILNDLSVAIRPAVTPPQIIGFFQLSFNDTPQTISPHVDLTAQTTNVAQGSVTLTIACIHGSSLIQTQSGLKRIDTLTDKDYVLSGDHLDTYVKVKSVAQCWISTPGPSHDAIIFEAGSLGEDLPSERLIIDPGHPMALKSDFIKSGINSLKPAGTYLDDICSDKIYTRKWTDPIIQADSSLRYDLILEEPYLTYIANNIVVRTMGYNHSYGHLT